MKYDELREKLNKLENKWRGRLRDEDREIYKSLAVCHQFFVLDGATSGKNAETIVVLVGINYTQVKEWKAKSYYKTAEAEHDEDGKIDQQNDTIRTYLCAPWDENPLSGCAKYDFHLVFTNLSPFITTKNWGNLNQSERDCLLENKMYEAYLSDLKNQLSGDVVWIGHTESIRKELKDVFAKLGVKKFYLCNNLGWAAKNPNFTINNQM